MLNHKELENAIREALDMERRAKKAQKQIALEIARFTERNRTIFKQIAQAEKIRRDYYQSLAKTLVEIERRRFSIDLSKISMNGKH